MQTKHTENVSFGQIVLTRHRGIDPSGTNLCPFAFHCRSSGHNDKHHNLQVRQSCIICIGCEGFLANWPVGCRTRFVDIKVSTAALTVRL
jgi:hypothetical protein